MAVDDIDTLRQQIPDLFVDRSLPSTWEDDWIIIPVERPEGELQEGELLDAPDSEASPDAFPTAGPPAPPALTRDEDAVDFAPDSELPRLENDTPFAGAPLEWNGQGHPPPDALAFCLPFHYFHPTWWGVYLVLDRVHWLARQLHIYSGASLGERDALVAARIFLYGHEAFHHAVEAFATRLEITHRVPLYRMPFETYYRQRYGTSSCTEEALATAYGYRKLASAWRRHPVKRRHALEALERYIRRCPPGYAEAIKLLENRQFNNARAAFAEENHCFALPAIPGREPVIWHSAPHAFTGISRVTSRVNYIVHRDSSLALRHRLGLRYLRHRDLAKRLHEGGCRIVRQGRGSHEIWQAPNGNTFQVPVHPGDLRKGTLAKIIKQAGYGMSVSEFLAVAGVP